MNRLRCPTLAPAGAILAWVACASTQTYPLATAGRRPQETFEPLLQCARDQSLEGRRHADGIEVLAPAGTIRFSTAEAGTYAMWTDVDSSKVAPQQVKAKMATLKKQGDDLFACAMRDAPGAGTFSAVPIGAAHPEDSCARLNACYREVVARLCAPADSACAAKFSFNVTHDAAACQTALNRLPSQTAPLQRVRPEFSLPAACAPAADGPTGALSEPPGSSSWSGTWNAHATFRTRCQAPTARAAPHRGEVDWKVAIHGPRDHLAGELSEVPLHGAASATSMRMCGAFPLAEEAEHAATATSDVCLVVDSMASSDHALGHLEGEFATAQANCRVTHAQVDLTR